MGLPAAAAPPPCQQQQHHLTCVCTPPLRIGSSLLSRWAASGEIDIMEMRNYMQQVGMPARWPGRDGAGKGTALKTVHGVVACGWEIDWCGTVFPYKLSPTPPAAASKPLQLIGTQHYGGAYPGNTFSSRDTPIQADQAADFHVFALEWEQKQVAGCWALHVGCWVAHRCRHTHWQAACLPATMLAVLLNGAAYSAAAAPYPPFSTC